MTVLGSTQQVRRQGRYTHLYGTFWRSRKRGRIGRAAAGLLADIWSFCADQRTTFVGKRDMQKLLAGDPNGRRQLNELVREKFVDVAGDGWAPHNYSLRNGFIDDTEEECDTGCDTTCDTGCDESVMNAPPVIIQESTSPRAHADPRSQIPEERSLDSSGVGGAGGSTADAAAPPAQPEPPVDPSPFPPEPPPATEFKLEPSANDAKPPKPARERKPRKRDLELELLKRVVLGEEREAADLSPFSLPPAVIGVLLGKARREVTQQRADSLESALRRIAREAFRTARETRKAPKWALDDWQPGGARVVPMRGRVEPARSTSEADFADAPDAEEVLARARAVRERDRAEELARRAHMPEVAYG